MTRTNGRVHLGDPRVPAGKAKTCRVQLGDPCANGRTHASEVKVLLKLNLSGLYPTVTASPRGGVGSNGRGTGSPQNDERDSA